VRASRKGVAAGALDQRPGRLRQTDGRMGIKPPRRLHGGERAGPRRRGMKLRGQTLRRGQMRHDELTIPSPQPRLHLGRFRNIPTVIVQWLDKK